MRQRGRISERAILSREKRATEKKCSLSMCTKINYAQAIINWNPRRQKNSGLVKRVVEEFRRDLAGGENMLPCERKNGIL
jgi:hypothetical protein